MWDFCGLSHFCSFCLHIKQYWRVHDILMCDNQNVNTEFEAICYWSQQRNKIIVRRPVNSFFHHIRDLSSILFFLETVISLSPDIRPAPRGRVSGNFSAFPWFWLLMSPSSPWPFRAVHILRVERGIKRQEERECKQRCRRSELSGRCKEKGERQQVRVKWN